ncbi:hypothetical protein V6N11_006401 [Hibiscus sabdariffa]|uniref:Transducin beta-like protein 2 n=1 Tax=Hibiscus sabdariffa TaxID=183260 RepID=A0ABR2RQX8_9ROSI
MDPILGVLALSIVLGALIAFVFFKSYVLKQKSQVQATAKPEPPSDPKKPSKPPQRVPKKFHSKPQPHLSDQDQSKRHHPLDLNTLKGHSDSVTGLCFSSDAHSLATACADGVVRVFKLDDASSKSFKFFRINVPIGGHAVAVVFSDDSSSIVVASQTVTGCSLYMYEEENPKKGSDESNQQKPPPQVKWEHHKIHDKQAILTLTGATSSYGTGDGSTIVASCSEGTDILLWHGRTGKVLGHVDTNQLKNTMATISPNGRFVTAAAFTADVKIWEIIYAKDGSVKEVTNVMQLKGHKACNSTHSPKAYVLSFIVFTSFLSYQIFAILSVIECSDLVMLFSELGANYYSIQGWYNKDLEHQCVSPNGKILAATHGPTLQWLCLETGKVLDTAEKAHDDDITWISWSPKPIPLGNGQVVVLATASVDKKVKLWAAPSEDSNSN